MKINFRGVGAEELSFKMNRVRLEPNARLDIKPQFSRQVRKVKDNEKLNFIALSLKVESTEAEPKPFNINVTLVGTFEVEDAPRRQRAGEGVRHRGHQDALPLSPRGRNQPHGFGVRCAPQPPRNQRPHLPRRQGRIRLLGGRGRQAQLI